ncbi:MAG: haloacid dehalogenase type II [Phycisphaerales bacterium]
MPAIQTPDAITFDCYGTLIDWSSGILAALAPFRHRIGIADDAALLAAYAEHEHRVEAGAWLAYRDVLREVFCALVPGATDAEADTLPESVKHWRPFADTVPALRRLGGRARLAIVSNIDDDLIASTLKKLEVEFAAVVTAEQVRSYKPGHAHFREVCARLKLEPARILHAAESRFHDIAPARELGFPTVWVSRAGPSTSGVGDAVPDAEVATLAELADLLDA